jgi:ribonucleoside-diphosphate reductase beta chain
MSVLNTNNKNGNQLFFGESLGIQRYDNIKYQWIEKLIDKQLGFFWRPEEVNLSRDSKDFKDLSETEKHIFTSNIKRQIVLDSVQSRSPALAFLPLVTSPELENWVTLWSFNESIHSRSYTHIIRNVYPNPSVVLDTVLDTAEIISCANDITKYYDDLIQATETYNRVCNVGDLDITMEKSLCDLKKQLWLCINSVNALEGVRFYVSFACSWAFAELRKMEGNAKIIKLICRDENVHLGFTQQLLKALVQEDPDFAKIKLECEQEVLDMFSSIVQQEKEWADYLFKGGSIIGLNAEMLKLYIDYIANKRLIALGYKNHKIVSNEKNNPLPWTNAWISSGDTQVAPQETAITSYTIGDTVADITEETLKGLEL